MRRLQTVVRGVHLAAVQGLSASAAPAGGGPSRALVVSGMGACALIAAAAVCDSNEPRLADASFAVSGLVPPLLRLLDAEQAHWLAVRCTSLGLVPRERRPDPASLQARTAARVATSACLRSAPAGHPLGAPLSQSARLGCRL